MKKPHQNQMYTHLGRLDNFWPTHNLLYVCGVSLLSKYRCNPKFRAKNSEAILYAKLTNMLQFTGHSLISKLERSFYGSGNLSLTLKVSPIFHFWISFFISHVSYFVSWTYFFCLSFIILFNVHILIYIINFSDFSFP